MNQVSPNLSFAVGEIFVMELQGTDTAALFLSGSSGAPPGQPLYSQPLYLNGFILKGSQLSFKTYVASSAQCNDDKNPCTTDTCDVVTGMCHANNALPCTDNDMCTQNDVCSAGACVPGAPVMCAALDGWHAVGVCNPMTGQCTDPVKPLDCSAKSFCEQDGLCDPASGACLNPAKVDGVPCGEGVCIAGTCSDEAGNTTRGGTSTTGSASTSTGTNTGVGGAGAGGAGAGGAGTGSVEERVMAAGGCGCAMPGTSPVRAPWLLLGLLRPAWRRRRQAPEGPTSRTVTPSRRWRWDGKDTVVGDPAHGFFFPRRMPWTHDAKNTVSLDSARFRASIEGITTSTGPPASGARITLPSLL